MDKWVSIGQPLARGSCKSLKNGAPGRIRTSDRLVRSQVLYPAELRAHFEWIGDYTEITVGCHLNMAEREGLFGPMALTPSGPPATPAFCATSSRLSNRLIDTSRVRILVWHGTKKAPSGLFYLAEREGFEPSMGINPYSLSRGAPSATRPPLRETHFTVFTAHHHQPTVGITPAILPSVPFGASVAALRCSKSLPAILSNPRWGLTHTPLAGERLWFYCLPSSGYC